MPMPAVSPVSGLIVTRDIEMPEPGGFTRLAEAHAATAGRLAAAAEKLRVDNRTREHAARSTGFEVGHFKMKQAEVAATGGADYYGRLAAAATSIETVATEVTTAHTALVGLAEAELGQPDANRAEIIRRYHDAAKRATEVGVTTMEAAIESAVNGPGAPNISALTSMLSAGGTPTPAAPPPTVDGLDDAKNPGLRGENDSGSAHDEGPTQTTRSDPSARDSYEDASSSGGQGEPEVPPGVSVGNNNPGQRSDYALPPATTPGQGSPSAGGAPSVSNLGELLGGGGLGSGGTPSVPSGVGSGGMPGVGSTPLAGGLGEMPGAAGGLAGAGGVPGSASSASSPASAFSRGMATGAGMGGGVPTVPPSAPASPSPALSAGGSAVPASAAGAGGGVSGLAAQPGMAAPAAPAATPGAGMGGAPMMMPPGAMGPPAAAVPPAAAPTAPAGAGAGAGSAHAAPAPAASTGGGATLVPASVVAAGQAAAARERQESPDAAAAKELVWKLQHAAVKLNSAATDWAVGIFRSPSGTETVMTTSDGMSFIPHGVHVPRSVRLLAADPLVDEHFRQLWFGWHDPARVLVDYARLRSETDWRLVAAATTGPVTALRDEGVEHPPTCSRETNRLLGPGEETVPAPLDDLHVHRLSLLWPEVYPRLQRVMEADPVYQDRIVNAVGAYMLSAATTQAVAIEGGIPETFRRVWSTRGAPTEPNAQEWAAYDEQAPRFNVQVAMARPGFISGAPDPSETVDEVRNYRAHWLVARTAEHIAGWSRRPLPLPDMCYSALALEQPHIRNLIEEALSSVEDDLPATGAA